MSKYLGVKNIALNGIVAAVYAVITIACGPLSYEFMQLRFSELLNLLVFFNPSFTVGLTLGCLLANLESKFYDELECSDRSVAVVLFFFFR